MKISLENLSIHDIPFWLIVILQTLFFIYFIFLGIYNLSFSFTFLFVIMQIALISVYLLKIKNYKKIFFLVSQFEIFLYFLILIIFFPHETFPVGEIAFSVIITLSFILIFAESLFLIYFIYKERFIKHILFVLASSTTLLVFLIVIFVAFEAAPAFQENDPVEFFIGTEEDFNPIYDRGFSKTVLLTTNIEPSVFKLSTTQNPFYIPPNSIKNITLTIENKGKNLDIFYIDVDTTFDYELESNKTKVLSYQSKDLNLSISSTGLCSETIEITVTSENTKKTTRLTIDCFVSSYGITIDPNYYEIFSQLDEDAGNTILYRVSNLGKNKDTFIFKTKSSNNFVPMIRGHSDFAQKDQGNIRIIESRLKFDPYETKELEFKPNFNVKKEGIYNIDIEVFSENLTNIRSSAEINYTYFQSSIILLKDTTKNILSNQSAVYHAELDPGEFSREKIIFSTKLTQGNADLKVYHKGKLILEGETSKEFKINKTGRSNLTIVVTPVSSNFNEIKTQFKISDPGSTPTFVALPFIVTTIFTTLIAVLIAAPLGVGIAILLAEFIPNKIRKLLRPLYELLAGIPSVLYGLWGYFTLGPVLSETIYPYIANTIGTVIPFFSATSWMGKGIFTASIVLSIMIIPIVITLSEDSIRSVKRSLKEGALALGTTRWQTMRHIILPRAKSGVVSSIILGTGRAIGETMAVLMIMSTVVNTPGGIFDRGLSMTGVIANLFDRGIEFDFTRHGIFAIGLLLFIMVFFLNGIIAYIQSRAIEDKKGRKKTPIYHNIFTRLQKPFLYKKDNQNKSFNIGKINEEIYTEKTSIDTKERKDKKIDFFKTSNLKQLKRTLFYEKFVMTILICIATLISFFVGYIIFDILVNGGTAISPDLFLETEKGLGEGGFLNAIVGSLYLVIIALIFAAPLSIGAAIYVNEYANKKSIITKIILFTSDTLASTPSIIFGGFGFLLFVSFLGFKHTLFAGGITLGIMIIPIMLRSSIEAIKAIPRDFYEGALALGVTKWQSIRTVIIPPATAGIISGVIISMGRAIGETAAVLLTAGYAQSIPKTILHGAASMPNLIWNYYDLQGFNPNLIDKLYVAAAILIIIVLTMNFVARLFGHRASRMMKE